LTLIVRIYYFDVFNAELFFVAVFEDQCGSQFMKTYWITSLSKLKVVWSKGNDLCKTYGMEVVSLDTYDEQEYFFGMCVKFASAFTGNSMFGAMARVPASKKDWYWVNSGTPVNYTLNFATGEPNNGGNGEMCLALKEYSGSFGFNDVSCSDSLTYNIICQEHNFS
jgi:hypothetical protein